MRVGGECLKLWGLGLVTEEVGDGGEELHKGEKRR